MVKLKPKNLPGREEKRPALAVPTYTRQSHRPPGEIKQGGNPFGGYMGQLALNP